MAVYQNGNLEATVVSHSDCNLFHSKPAEGSACHVITTTTKIWDGFQEMHELLKAARASRLSYPSFIHDNVAADIQHIKDESKYVAVRYVNKMSLTIVFQARHKFNYYNITLVSLECLTFESKFNYNIINISIFKFTHL